MPRTVCLGALVLFASFAPRSAHAQRAPEADPEPAREPEPTPEERARTEARRAADEARFELYGLTYSGTRLVGEASRGRYRLGGTNVAVAVDRFFGIPGFAARLEGFTTLTGSSDLDFFRLEGAGAARVARWGGDFPGGVAVYAGVGGDLGRYWYAEDGRFYGLARAKARVWLSDETPLQVSYTAIPFALATGDVSLHEHRIEIASGYWIFGFGARIALTVVNGGSRDRTFVQQELGGFVSLGVFE